MIEVQAFTNAKYFSLGSLLSESKIAIPTLIVNYRAPVAPNAGHQRRARTAASDKPRMRDMLIARPLHAFVIFALRFSTIQRAPDTWEYHKQL